MRGLGAFAVTVKIMNATPTPVPLAFSSVNWSVARQNGSTKERLLQVAKELFAQKGFHGASTREITQRAGTNLSSLYFHWQSKENLYLAVYRQLFQELTALAQEVTDLLEDGLHARRRLEEVIDPVTDRIFTFFDG